jgi:hypothetical protein
MIQTEMTMQFKTTQTLALSLQQLVPFFLASRVRHLPIDFEGKNPRLQGLYE